MKMHSTVYCLLKLLVLVYVMQSYTCISYMLLYLTF